MYKLTIISSFRACFSWCVCYTNFPHSSSSVADSAADRAVGSPKSVPAEVKVRRPQGSELLNGLSGTNGFRAAHGADRGFADCLVATALGGGARLSMPTGRDVLADGSGVTRDRVVVLKRNPGGSSSYLGLCIRPLRRQCKLFSCLPGR